MYGNGAREESRREGGREWKTLTAVGGTVHWGLRITDGYIALQSYDFSSYALFCSSQDCVCLPGVPQHCVTLERELEDEEERKREEERESGLFDVQPIVGRVYKPFSCEETLDLLPEMVSIERSGLTEARLWEVEGRLWLSWMNSSSSPLLHSLPACCSSMPPYW